MIDRHVREMNGRETVHTKGREKRFSPSRVGHYNYFAVERHQDTRFEPTTLFSEMPVEFELFCSNRGPWCGMVFRPIATPRRIRLSAAGGLRGRWIRHLFQGTKDENDDGR